MPRRSTCNTLPGRAGTTLPAQAAVSGIIKSAVVPPRADLEGRTAMRQLAEDMRQASQREGGVSRDDLKLLGWTGTQLDLYGEMARTRAQSLSRASM